jgi:Rps23 Pro-64 3,4-dihydroxylase Tpa1-like proline 4-hydroxylase
MLHELSALIVERLQRETERLQAAYEHPEGVQTRCAIVDDVLPRDIAARIYEAFPPVAKMRLLSSFRERKYTSKALDTVDPLIADATFAFQAPGVIAEVARITRIRDMVGDPQLYAGGISAMTKGQFLNPHIDNSHDSERGNYRVLNLLYYVTPDWKLEFGGSLELWDTAVRRRVEIPSLFNRLLIMETNQFSWHSVNRIEVAGTRCCVSNYYFSPHPPTGKDVFHVTFFQARPEQPVLRLFTTADSHARTIMRKVFRSGLSRNDVYTGKTPRN